MPSATQQLGLPEARALIASWGFGGAPDDCNIGVELESFLVPAREPNSLPDVTLPAGSRLTFEPGGQLELSAPPGPTVAAACAPLATDLAALGKAFSTLGVQLVQCGLSPGPLPAVMIDTPRYRAMEAYFDTCWPREGRTMMCGSAAVQVNVGFGGPVHAARRWRAANALGPVLAAAFSCSAGGRGRHNRRLANWLRLDPGRTAPMATAGEPGQIWAEYALDAGVMLMRSGERCVAVVDRPITLREWVERGHPLGWPGKQDLAYHLTTLFPPVRPRGWMELRMIDALPDPWWRVAVAAAAVLIDDDEAAAAAGAVSGRWWQAARDGLDDPMIGPAASLCATRTLAGLDRAGTDDVTAMLTEQWAAAVGKGGDLPWT